MNASWGHTIHDERRHIIQYHRDGVPKCRRACQTDRLLLRDAVLPGSDKSDLPLCQTCVRVRRRLYLPHPETRPGWIAGAPGQATLDPYGSPTEGL